MWWLVVHDCLTFILFFIISWQQKVEMAREIIMKCVNPKYFSGKASSQSCNSWNTEMSQTLSVNSLLFKWMLVPLLFRTPHTFQSYFSPAMSVTWNGTLHTAWSTPPTNYSSDVELGEGTPLLSWGWRSRRTGPSSMNIFFSRFQFPNHDTSKRNIRLYSLFGSAAFRWWVREPFVSAWVTLRN